MTTYTKIIQKAIDRFPLGCLTDWTLQTLESNKYLANPTQIPFKDFSNTTCIDESVAVITRFFVALLAYPRLAPLTSLANMAVGILHLGLGFVERFRTTESMSQNNQAWQSIAQNIHKGFCHLLLAGYDAAVWLTLRQRPYGIVPALAFAASPLFAKAWNQHIFNTSNEPFKMAPEQLNNVPQVVLVLMMNFFLKNLHAQLHTLLPYALMEQPTKNNSTTSSTTTSTTAQPSLPAQKNYIGKGCMINCIAVRITSSLLPQIVLPP